MIKKLALVLSIVFSSVALFATEPDFTYLKRLLDSELFSTAYQKSVNFQELIDHRRFAVINYAVKNNKAMYPALEKDALELENRLLAAYMYISNEQYTADTEGRILDPKEFDEEVEKAFDEIFKSEPKSTKLDFVHDTHKFVVPREGMANSVFRTIVSHTETGKVIQANSFKPEYKEYTDQVFTAWLKVWYDVMNISAEDKTKSGESPAFAATYLTRLVEKHLGFCKAALSRL